MKKEHGEHNEKICSFLLSDGNYPDWVITTAFYSSIHYIDHKIFPCTHKGNTFRSIDEAHFYFRSGSRHKTRQCLVELNLPSQAANYLFLDKICRNARYINYKVSKDKAKIAHQRLQQIKAACV